MSLRMRSSSRSVRRFVASVLGGPLLFDLVSEKNARSFHCLPEWTSDGFAPRKFAPGITELYKQGKEVAWLSDDPEQFLERLEMAKHDTSTPLAKAIFEIAAAVTSDNSVRSMRRRTSRRLTTSPWFTAKPFELSRRHVATF